MIQEEGKIKRWTLWLPQLATWRQFLDCSIGRKKQNTAVSLRWGARDPGQGRSKSLERVGLCIRKEGDAGKDPEIYRGATLKLWLMTDPYIHKRKLSEGKPSPKSSKLNNSWGLHRARNSLCSHQSEQKDLLESSVGDSSYVVPSY